MLVPSSESSTTSGTHSHPKSIHLGGVVSELDALSICRSEIGHYSCFNDIIDLSVEEQRYQVGVHKIWFGTSITACLKSWIKNSLFEETKDNILITRWVFHAQPGIYSVQFN